MTRKPFHQRLWGKRHLTFAGALIIVGILLVPGILTQRYIDHNRSATFYFQRTDGSTTIDPGTQFTVELRVKTEQEPINAVGSYIKIDPTMLDILGITTEDSFCSLYADNSFDTIKGDVNVSCGVPNPGYGGDSPIVAIHLRAKVPGTTSLTLDSKQAFALANDGKGTNILKNPLPTFPIVINQTF